MMRSSYNSRPSLRPGTICNPLESSLSGRPILSVCDGIRVQGKPDLFFLGSRY